MDNITFIVSGVTCNMQHQLALHQQDGTFGFSPSNYLQMNCLSYLFLLVECHHLKSGIEQKM